MKKLIILVFTILIIFGLKSSVLAADLNVECPEPATVCTKTGVDPLFETSIDGFWYPGRSLTKTVYLKNNSSQKREMAVKGSRTSTINILENKMQLSIVGSGTIIWSGSLNDFYVKDKIILGTFNGGSSAIYNFTVSMDQNLQDDYKDKKTVFDMTLGFWGDILDSGGDGGNGGGTVSASVCNETKPEKPGNFSVKIGLQAGQALLSWNLPKEPLTYFLVAFSDNNISPKWGNPNIGKTDNFTVSGLGSGTYWFWLRSGNGCMTGDFVGPVSLSLPASNLIITTEENLPQGFTPILGEETPGEIDQESVAFSGGQLSFWQNLWQFLKNLFFLLKTRISAMIF